MADKPIPGAPQDPLIARLQTTRSAATEAPADPVADALPRDPGVASPKPPAPAGGDGPQTGAGATGAEVPGDHGSSPPPDSGLRAARAEIATLAAALATHRSQMRDLERALVDRIADVDDDRRLTAVQLQRAWQTHLEEVDRRDRRRGWRGALALLLLGLAGVGVLFLLGERMGAFGETAAKDPLGPVAAEVQELRQELERLADIQTQDALVQDKLASLFAAVGEISTALEALADRRAAGGELSADLAERVARLEAGQRGLVRAPVAETRQDGPPETESNRESGTAEGALPKEVADASGARGSDAGLRSDDDAQASEVPAATPGPQDAEAASNGSLAASADRPYALQLIGFFSRDQLLAVAARSDLPPRVYERRETLRGRPWFALIHSIHPTYADAQSELARLPPSLATMKPWIRKLPEGVPLEPLATGAAP